MVGPQLIVPDGMDDPYRPADTGGPSPLLLANGPLAIRYADNPAARAAIPGLHLVDDLGLAFADDPAPAAPRERARPAEAARVAQVPTEPATQDARDSAHRLLVRNAERLVSDINRSNNLIEQAPRAVAESTLRALTLFTWRGTGITQHSNWQRDIEARRIVINPPIARDGTVQLTPEHWGNCFREVQNHRDNLNRKWANCAEQAASLAHVIHQMINNPNDRSMAGLEVRQAFANGHSWCEVRYPNGQRMVYDPWSRLTGRIEDMPASYRRSASYTDWYGHRR